MMEFIGVKENFQHLYECIKALEFNCLLSLFSIKKSIK